MKIRLDELILPGIVINVRNFKPCERLELQQLISLLTLPNTLDTIPIRGKAVLFNFGWDRFWETEHYQNYPFISKEVAAFLVEEKVGLVGVDTFSVDCRDSRIVHNILLQNDIFVVQNLKGLDQLLFFKNFRFFALPLKIQKAASLPIRAFAEVEH